MRGLGLTTVVELYLFFAQVARNASATSVKPATGVVGVQTDLNRVVLAAATNAAGIAIPNVIKAVEDIVNAIQLVVPAHSKTEEQIGAVPFAPDVAFADDDVGIIAVNPHLGRQDIPLGDIAVEDGQFVGRPLEGTVYSPFGNMGEGGRTHQAHNSSQHRNFLAHATTPYVG